MTDLGPTLVRVLEPLVPMDDALVKRLTVYVELLQRWNRQTNLTGFRTTDELLLNGLADSLVPLPLLPDQGPCMDIGSGAGFPGLILAAAQPGRLWTLLEPRRKRASFLHEASRVMGLNRVEVLRQRLEQTDIVVPTITSRAVGGISTEVVAHLELAGAWILAASLDDAMQLEARGGYPGLRIDARKDSQAGGTWLGLTRV